MGMDNSVAKTRSGYLLACRPWQVTAIREKHEKNIG
jgi:hypothetical protein